MSDQELPPLPPDLASLLDAEKDRPDPIAASQDRLLSRLEASIAALPIGHGGGGHGGDGGNGSGGGTSGGGGGHAGSGAAGAGAGTLAGKASTIGASLLAKPVALAVGTFALGSAMGAAIDHASVMPEPPRTKIVYVDRVVKVASNPGPAPSPAPSDSTPPPPTTIATRVNAPAISSSTSAAPQGHDAELAGERALIEIARTALGKGDYAAALDALARHSARYPHGQLTEEREALAVESLAGAGKMDDARSRGARFKRDFPNSMLMPVVDSALH